MVDMTNDVIRFENMFADRFTEKDCVFMELKSKSLPNPVVIYPWKTQRKQWNKSWDYGNRRPQDNRRESGHYKDRKHGQNSYNKSEDQSRDGGNSRYRDRSQEGRRDNYRDRSQSDKHRDHSQSDRHRDRSQSDRHRDRSQGESNKPFDFQAALKAYQER